MTFGFVTLNGVTDQQLVKVLEAKIKHEGQLEFNTQQVRQEVVGQNKSVNNNVTVGWRADQGLLAVIGLLSELVEHEQRSTASA